ncbi:tape measure protein [Joostella sp. CR20]|uniref:tape measure protein n=1 Tax=Joostella sp. CR20 TaxID=2804312 RepID=UPI00313C63D9
MAKNLISAIQEGNKLLDQYDSKLQNIYKNVLNITDAFIKANKNTIGANSPSSVNNKVNQNTQYTKQLNAELRERERLLKALETQLAKNKLANSQLNKELQRERFETQQRNKLAREYAIISSKLSTEYQKQSVRLEQLRRKYKDVALTEGQASKEAKRLQREIQVLDRRLKSVDAAAGQYQRSVGNYGKAWKATGNLVRQAVAAFGVYSGIEIARQIYQDIKAVNAMNMALKQVTETTEAYNRTKAYLRDVSEEAGVELRSLTQSYTKFLASAKTTNLTIEETEDIFRQVAKAGSVLGLSADDVQGAFRALEQMLSKGNVQAEEIRGQLGERLPGAFQILAKSMGLTTQELNKELELGNVLADEVLPKFARELEKTYSLDTIDRVKSLVAEQNRLSNSWTGFVETLSSNDGVITNILTGTLGLVTGIVEGMRQLNLGAEGRNLEVSQKVFNDVLKQQLEYYESLGESAKEYAMIDAQSSAQRRNEYETQLELLKQTNKELKEENKNLGFNPIKYHANKIAISANNEEIQKLNVSIARENATLQAASQTLVGNTDALKSNTKSTISNNQTKKESKEVIEGSLNALEKTKKELEDEQRSLATNTDEWNKYQEQIDEVEKSIDKLTKGQKALNDVFSGEGTKSGTQDDLFGNNATAGFNQYLRDKDVENFKDTEKQKLEIQQRYADQREQIEQRFYDSIKDLAYEGINSIFESRVTSIDKQIDKNDEYYTNLLANENLTEEQRSALEAERDKKELQLEKEREKREKQAFLVRQGLAIADIAITAAQASIAALAPPPIGLGPILGGTLIPFIVGTAALQTGVVLAQTIPQLWTGGEVGENGEIIVNDDPLGVKGANYKEVIEEPNGKLSFPQGKNVKMKVPKGTKVHRNYDDFLASATGMNLQRAVFAMNMNAQGQAITESNADQAILSELRANRNSNSKVWKEVKKLANRPINNNVKVELKNSRSYYG